MSRRTLICFAFAVTELLLARGAEVNAESRSSATALWFAVENEKSDLVQLLLAYGAYGDCFDDNQVENAKAGGPLQIAAAPGAGRASVALLTEGADVSLECGIGETAQEIAEHQGHGDMVITIDRVSRLVELGTDFPEKNSNETF